MIFKHLEKVVGIFVIIAVIATITAIILLGNILEKFKDVVTYKSEFQTITGIDKGGKVYLKEINVPIGVITDYKLNDRNMVDVWYNIETDFIDKIREDSVAYLDVPPLGIGFASIKINIGYDPLRIEPGRKIPSSDSLEGQAILQKKFHKIEIADPISTILQNVARITSQISDPNGELFSTLRNIESITRQIRYGEGIIPSLYNSGELTHRVSGMLEDVHRIIKDVDDVILIQNENINRLLNEDVKKLLVLAENNIHIISREIAIIIENLKVLFANVQGTINNLLVKSEQKIEILLNILTKEIRKTITDISAIIKTILKDIALNTDPAVKSIITQVSRSIQKIVLTTQKIVQDMSQDVTGITRNIHKISSEVEVTVRDTSSSMKKITGKVGDILNQVEKILVNLESSTLLGGGFGGKSKNTSSRRKSERAFNN